MNSLRVVLPSLRRVGVALLLASAPWTPNLPDADAQSWLQYGGTAQHTAISPRPSQSLHQIVWQTPVDLQPQYVDGTYLLIHYGCPLSTPGNTILLPVKTGVTDVFRVEARRGADGSLLWQFDSDYRLPPGYSWTPSYGPALTPGGRVYLAGAGGTVWWIDDLDSPGPHVPTRVAFYGDPAYAADPAAFDADVRICSPLTSDAQGNVWFGFRATGANPLGLTSGIARIAPNGTGSFVPAATAIAETDGVTTMNCTPALSNDEQTLYVAMRKLGSFTTSPRYLVGLDATTLETRQKVKLLDPFTAQNSSLLDDGTASPMVAPDGKVFFGVLERPGGTNGVRGWMLRFDSTLAQLGPPGAFGWDDTPSLVPRTAVPSYAGASPYLLMVKYNNYAGTYPAPAGTGDGVNRLAILDPGDSQIDPRTGRSVMKEVLTIAGPTPDPNYIFQGYPNAVREWCINTAAVDTFTHSVLAGSEDGILYRWDLETNTFSESVVLTAGIGEAYTPTLVGHDGKVYAINNATLFAVGVDPTAVFPGGGAPALRLSGGRPTPFSAATTLTFTMPERGHATLTIHDPAGRRVATLVDRELQPGVQSARWNGCDDDGRALGNGIYFARLVAGARTAAAKLVLAR